MEDEPPGAEFFRSNPGGRDRRVVEEKGPGVDSWKKRVRESIQEKNGGAVLVGCKLCLFIFLRPRVTIEAVRYDPEILQ